MELAVFPPGASLESFDWRISMARVERDGPFSPFPDVDRTILVQSGTGLSLTIDGVETSLSHGDLPFHFSGDSQTTCRLVDGPVTDINVMSRRSVCAHAVARVAAGAHITGLKKTIVLATTPISVDALSQPIDAGDLLTLEPGESLTIANGHALVIQFVYSGV